jgi:pseudouridine-5'-phosphate glycosidase
MLQRARLLSRGFTTSTGHLKDSLQEAVHRGAPIDIHPEVEHALRTRAAVVALESTIITHGMPYPTNLTTARSVESIVRSTGAVPATIGLIHGRVKIGLEPRELERLADVENNRGVVKLSRRDLGPAIALKRDGGTTCSSTLIFAALAGIKVRVLLSNGLAHSLNLSVFLDLGILYGRVRVSPQRPL